MDQILDEDLKAGQNKTNDGDEEEPEVVPSEVQRKILLVEKGKPPLEALPEGWIQTVHKSGMPVYLHKASRVACITRPYFLGPGSIRVSVWMGMIAEATSECDNFTAPLDPGRGRALPQLQEGPGRRGGCEGAKVSGQ